MKITKRFALNLECDKVNRIQPQAGGAGLWDQKATGPANRVTCLFESSDLLVCFQLATMIEGLIWFSFVPSRCNLHSSAHDVLNSISLSLLLGQPTFINDNLALILNSSVATCFVFSLFRDPLVLLIIRRQSTGRLESIF
jgi:hypothetical protein